MPTSRLLRFCFLLVLALLICSCESDNVLGIPDDANIFEVRSLQENVAGLRVHASLAPFEYIASEFDSTPTLSNNNYLLDYVTVGLEEFPIVFRRGVAFVEDRNEGNIASSTKDAAFSIEYKYKDYSATATASYFIRPIGNFNIGLFKWIDRINSLPIENSAKAGKVPMLIALIPCSYAGTACAVDVLHHDGQWTKISIYDENSPELAFVTEENGETVNHWIKYIGNGYALYHLPEGGTKVIQCIDSYCSGFGNDNIPDPLKINIGFIEMRSYITNYAVEHE